MVKKSVSCLALADSSGSRIDIEDEDSWTIGDFYAQYDYKPSRYKLYVMYVPPVSESILCGYGINYYSGSPHSWQSSSSEDELLNIYRRRVVPTSGASEGSSRSQGNTPLGLSHGTTTPAGPSPPPLVSMESRQKTSVGKEPEHDCV